MGARRLGKWIAAAVALPAIALLLALFFVATQPGLSALAGLAEFASGGRLKLEGGQGRLLGPLAFKRISYLDGERLLEAEGLTLRWAPAALLDDRLAIVELAIASLDFATRPTAEPPKPPQLPANLRLPWSLTVERARLGRLRLLLWPERPDDPRVPYLTLENVAAQFASDGRQHDLSSLSLTSPIGRVAGAISLGGEAPFPLQAQLQLRSLVGEDRSAYALDIDAAGPLADFVLRATASGWQLDGSARIEATPFAAAPFRRARVALAEIDPALFAAGAPHARLRLVANLEPQAASSPGAGLAALEVAGPLTITNARPGTLDRGLIPVQSLNGRLSWRDGVLSLEDMALDPLGSGRAEGMARLKEQHLHVELGLAAIDPRAWHGMLKSGRLDGTIVADASLAEQSLEARLTEKGPTPWRGELIARHKDRRISLESLRLAARDARLEAKGAIALTDKREFQLDGSMHRFDPAAYADVPGALINAEFSARGNLNPEPVAAVRFSLNDSRINTRAGSQPLSGSGSLTLAAGRLSGAEVGLDLAGNRLDISGAYGRPGDVLNLLIEAPRLAALGTGFAGRVSARARLLGTPRLPAGEIDAEVAGLRLPGGLEVEAMHLSGRMEESAAGPANDAVTATLTASGVRLPGEPPRRASISATLAGRRSAHAVDAAVRVEAQPSVPTTIELAAFGGMAEGPSWRGDINRLQLRHGDTELALQAPATLATSAGHVRLGPAELLSRRGRLRLRETSWTSEGWGSRGDFSGLLMEPRGGAGRVRGSLTLAGAWDLRAEELPQGGEINGTLEVHRQAGDLAIEEALALGLRELSLAATVKVNQLDARLTASGERLGLLTASLAATLQGAALALDRAAPLAGSARLETPSLAWLGPMIAADLRLEGAASGVVELAGTPAQPAVSGRLTATRLGVALPGQGVRLSDGRLVVEFSEDRAYLRELVFRSPPPTSPPDRRISLAGLDAPGLLTGTGEIRLADGRGSIVLDAERLLLFSLPKRWLMLSGQARIESGGEGLAIAGKLRADAAYFELPEAAPPSLSDDVVVLGREAGRKPLRIDVDLALDLGRRSYFQGRGLDTRLVGQLALRGEARGLLRASGSIAARDGTFNAYGQLLEIERGIVNFQGPLDNPGLNVVAYRQGLPVEAGVEITGTLKKPRVRLVSDPPMPDADKLSWIVLGRGPDQASEGDIALLLSAARAILGGRDGGPGITERLAQTLGLDEFRLRRGDLAAGGRMPVTTVAGTSFAGAGATDSLATQIVVLGKRISARTTVSYEQSLAGAASVLKITYELTRRLSLVGRAGIETSLDIYYTFSFR